MFDFAPSSTVWQCSCLNLPIAQYRSRKGKDNLVLFCDDFYCGITTAFRCRGGSGVVSIHPPAARWYKVNYAAAAVVALEVQDGNCILLVDIYYCS